MVVFKEAASCRVTFAFQLYIITINDTYSPPPTSQTGKSQELDRYRSAAHPEQTVQMIIMKVLKYRSD